MALLANQILEVSSIEKIKIHRNLSFEDYFSGYSRQRDGAVKIATYSFNSRAFSTMHRLMPFSSIYVDIKHKSAAEKFARRFPLYVIYIVKNLHTKCIYFEKSGKFLIGSQNLFAPTSTFEEASCEIVMASEEGKEIANELFNFKNAEYLCAEYCVGDIKKYGVDKKSIKGLPFLPCHLEVGYWASITLSDDIQCGDFYHYIYCYLEYSTPLGKRYLAFDRHYQFCGELTEKAVEFLRNQFSVRSQKFSFLDQGNQLKSSAPFKDLFSKFHPVARDMKPVSSNYISL